MTVSLELGGALPVPVIDGTKVITVEFHVLSNEDMGCDAILGSDAMRDLTQKYGKEAVSHDNSWVPRIVADVARSQQACILS
jgi:hypothetical protein